MFHYLIKDWGEREAILIPEVSAEESWAAFEKDEAHLGSKRLEMNFKEQEVLVASYQRNQFWSTITIHCCELQAHSRC